MSRWIQLLRLLYLFEKFLDTSLGDTDVSGFLFWALHRIRFSGSRLAVSKYCAVIALKKSKYENLHRLLWKLACWCQVLHRLTATSFINWILSRKKKAWPRSLGCYHFSLFQSWSRAALQHTEAQYSRALSCALSRAGAESYRRL